MSTTKARLISFAGRTLATAALMTAGSVLMHAQSARTNPSPQTVSAQEPALNLQLPASSTADQAYSSSSADNLSDTTGTAALEVASATAKPFPFLNAFQYGGGRQRYGRPRYRGGNTNADGSSKYDFYVGGGFGIPIGTQTNYLTTGYGFNGGGGRMFNKNFGVNIEFAYNHFNLTDTTVNNQENLYNNYITLYNQYCANNPTDPGCIANGGGVGPISGLGGNSHIWSFSLQPVYNIRSGEGLGVYVTGGAGFYHKVANFTEPAVGEQCDPYYGCYQYEANQNIDHYTSNAPGFDGGVGVTYKFSRFASERLYAEVRYVYVLNSARAGVDASTCTTLACASTNSSVANDFPANSNRTSYLPVTIGLRF